MRTFERSEVIQVLETTPSVLSVLLSNLPDEWVNADEGPETWSPFDVVGHLIHGEKTDWVPRMRMILDDDTSDPFPAFDRTAQFEESKGKSLSMLLEEFEQRREENAAYLKRQTLTDADLAKTGMHPDLGEVTLQQLLSAWVVHDLSHLRQIARVLAKQYKGEIGPWEAYLPVVHE